MLVGIEFAGHHGFTFAHDLARRGYRIVTVLPSATKRLKDVGTNRTRKSDDIDAWQICKLVRQGAYVSYPLLDPVYTTLRLLTTARRRLKHEEVRFKNRLQGILDLAWPEYLRYFADLEQVTPVAILARSPLPEDLIAADEAEVREVIRTASRNHVGTAKIDELLEAARATVALTTAAAVRRQEITEILERWALVRRQIAATDARIAATVAECAPARALATIPEVGPVCAATIVAELGTPDDFESPRQVLALAGMDLSGKQSGTSVRSGLRGSKRGRPVLRRELYLLAGPLGAPDARPLSPAVRRHARAQREQEDQGRLRHRAQARADAPRRRAVGPPVRPRALARRPPASRAAEGDGRRAGAAGGGREPVAQGTHARAGLPGSGRGGRVPAWGAPTAIRIMTPRRGPSGPAPAILES